jgi:hypothetical protein
MGLNRPFNRKEGRRVMERDNSVLRRPIGHENGVGTRGWKETRCAKWGDQLCPLKYNYNI